MYKVLFVDDDSMILDANKAFFEKFNYTVFCAENAQHAIEYLKNVQLDCVVLDIALPDGDGFDVCLKAREFTSIPIVFLSSFLEEESRVNGLLIGGDDYVCKPYSLRELELRVRARIQRRYEDKPAELLKFGKLTIDTGNRTVYYGTEKGEFLRIEFDLLVFLARHPNQAFSYEQLYNAVWKEPMGSSRHNLQARIAKVRQKLFALCPDHEYIQTIRHLGYLFIP